MSIRVATFNVENLFDRPAAMNLKKWEDGQQYIDDCSRLNTLLNQESYSDKDKDEILTMLEKYGLDKTWGTNTYLALKEIRYNLLAHPKDKRAQVIASGRGDWVGWVELVKAHIEDEAIANTARVIADVNPDIIILVEAESRPTLIRFHDSILKPLMKKMGLEPYPHLMLIDGNDPRGIDVGIMSRYPVIRMVSHVDDRTNAGSPMFSRDCPEYYLELPDGSEIVVLPNHFASQGSDKKGDRRRVQSAAVKAIYQKIRKTHSKIIVGGDLNQSPHGGSLDPLLKETDLQEAMFLPIYQGKFKGTYDTATETKKFDYLLLSPVLSQNVTKVDVNRKGFYAPKKWESYENINKQTKDRFNASDHQLVWADIEL